MDKASRGSLLVIFVTVFIDLLGFGIVLPLLPIYAEHFDPAPWMLGLLMASFSIMQFVFAPIWGRISDRVGRRPILMVGLAGSTFFYFLFGYASSLGEQTMFGLGALAWLFITRIGAGIAGATIPTAQAYIADVTGPKERARGMALIGAAFGIGFTFGPLLGAAFVGTAVAGPMALVQPDVIVALELSDAQQAEVKNRVAAYDTEIAGLGLADLQEQRTLLRADRDADLLNVLNHSQLQQWERLRSEPPSPTPGYVASILSGIAFLLAVFLLRESLKGSSTAHAHHWLDTSSLQRALAKPKIGLILLTMFITTFSFAQFEVSLSLLVREHFELSLQQVFFVFAYIGLVLTISQGFLVRRLVPKVGEFWMSLAGTLFMTVGLLAIGLAAIRESLTMLYVVIPLAVIGFSALTPSLQSLLSRHTAASDQGGILGLGQSVAAMARILGPVSGIVLFKASIASPYWVAAVIMAVGMLLTLTLKASTAQLSQDHN